MTRPDSYKFPYKIKNRAKQVAPLLNDVTDFTWIHIGVKKVNQITPCLFLRLDSSHCGRDPGSTVSTFPYLFFSRKSDLGLLGRCDWYRWNFAFSSSSPVGKPPRVGKQMVVPVPSEVVQGEEAVETTPMYTPEDERLKHDFLEVWFGSFSFLNGCIRRFHVNLPGCNLTWTGVV